MLIIHSSIRSLSRPEVNSKLQQVGPLAYTIDLRGARFTSAFQQAEVESEHENNFDCTELSYFFLMVLSPPTLIVFTASKSAMILNPTLILIYSAGFGILSARSLNFKRGCFN